MTIVIPILQLYTSNHTLKNTYHFLFGRLFIKHHYSMNIYLTDNWTIENPDLNQVIIRKSVYVYASSRNN